MKLVQLSFVFGIDIPTLISNHRTFSAFFSQSTNLEESLIDRIIYSHNYLSFFLYVSLFRSASTPKKRGDDFVFTVCFNYCRGSQVDLNLVYYRFR